MMIKNAEDSRSSFVSILTKMIKLKSITKRLKVITNNFQMCCKDKRVPIWLSSGQITIIDVFDDFISFQELSEFQMFSSEVFELKLNEPRMFICKHIGDLVKFSIRILRYLVIWLSFDELEVIRPCSRYDCCVQYVSLRSSKKTTVKRSNSLKHSTVRVVVWRGREGWPRIRH